MNAHVDELNSALLHVDQMLQELEAERLSYTSAAEPVYQTIKKRLAALSVAKRLIQEQAAEVLYDAAKAGDWIALLELWRGNLALGLGCAHYVKPSSGWTFLHQAAFHGNEEACRELIRLGAAPEPRGNDGMTPAEVAETKGHRELSSMFDTLTSNVPGAMWGPPPNADLLPSSNLWHEASARIADRDLPVFYADTSTMVQKGATYFVDSFGRILVGWHGTVSPPRGMDGQPMVGEGGV